MKKILTAVLMASTALAKGEAPNARWTEDFEAAKAQAAKEGKDLLVDFTGSDWCGWCQKLDKEVFDTDAFKTEIPKHFVLVKLDFPQKTPQDPKTKEQNGKLQKEYGIKGFPSVFLMDAAGKPYARTGYRPGGPAPYVEFLTDLRAHKGEVEVFLTKAQASQGVEKARLLDQYLTAQEKTGMGKGGRKKTIDEIITLDADNTAGLKGKYEVRQKLEVAQAAMQKKDADGALAALEEVIASPSADAASRQQAYFGKGMILMQAKQDHDGALASLEAAHKAAPDSPNAGQIKQAIEQLKSGSGQNGAQGAH